MKLLFKFNLFFLIPLSLFSQTQKFSNLSKYEKRWALCHPFAALKAKHLSDTIYKTYNEVKKSNALDKYENGGKLDAFRHIYAMALLTQHIKPSKIKKLGIAHEKGNYLDFLKHRNEEGELPDSISSVMDLNNNEIGISIGLNNKTLNPETLKDLILTLIKTSNTCYYIKRNDSGNYILCNGDTIIMNDYKGKWNIPKCLVHS